MIFLVSLVFIFLFYALPLNTVILEETMIFPFIGRMGSWLVAAALIYLSLALIALALFQFEDVIWPSLPRWRQAVTKRAGVHHVDKFGWRFSLLAAILFAGTDPRLIPLAVASALGFLSLTRR